MSQRVDGPQSQLVFVNWPLQKGPWYIVIFM